LKENHGIIYYMIHSKWSVSLQSIIYNIYIIYFDGLEREREPLYYSILYYTFNRPTSSRYISDGKPNKMCVGIVLVLHKLCEKSLKSCYEILAILTNCLSNLISTPYLVYKRGESIRNRFKGYDTI
jgi:hypothetical protein